MKHIFLGCVITCLAIFFGLSTSYAQGNPPTCESDEIYDTQKQDCVCNPAVTCCGIKLNTNVPFIGNCIEYKKAPTGTNANTTTVNPLTAFPVLVGGLSKIIVTAILVFSFVMILIGGVMMTMGGANDEMYNKGKSYIRHVVIALALLGASGIILRLINPNFFG